LKSKNLKDKPVDCPDSRVDFYNVFSKLIRMGSSDKQNDKNPRRHVSQIECCFIIKVYFRLKAFGWAEAHSVFTF
jgi:hypothetical protein